MSTIIITIGNEILTGHIQDTNTRWMAQRLFFLGEDLERVIIIGDDRNALSGLIRECVGRVDYLFICGGLGATPDDVTMSAVGDALERRCVVSDEALSHMEYLSTFLMEKGFIKQKMEVNDAVRKMATVIEGSTVLENKAGFCPGVTDTVGDTRIFVLPGVPQELKTIFTDQIENRYIRPNHNRFIDEIVLSEVEARIAHLIAKLNEDFPGVSVGSYPTYGAKTLVIRAVGEDEQQVRKVLEEIQSYSDSLPEL
ncbi:MAG: competence/damage-inducible protein A [Deltaproteobacteria bacterium]|nr:competence/damage-inducible protein A [Candidatus Zymogenaceae bacterium]